MALHYTGSIIIIIIIMSTSTAMGIWEIITTALSPITAAIVGFVVFLTQWLGISFHDEVRNYLIVVHIFY